MAYDPSQQPQQTMPMSDPGQQGAPQYQQQPGQYQPQPQYGSGQHPQYAPQPQYGQAPPQYAQQPGQYGSPQNTSPQYVPQPQYGSGQPQYGSGPQYGQQPMQTNGQPGPYGAPQYGQPMQPQGMPQPAQVLVVGGCSGGGGHQIDEEFTACGVCLGIFFFPIGLICCFAMKESRCVKCGAMFG